MASYRISSNYLHCGAFYPCHAHINEVSIPEVAVTMLQYVIPTESTALLKALRRFHCPSPSSPFLSGVYSRAMFYVTIRNAASFFRCSLRGNKWRQTQ